MYKNHQPLIKQYALENADNFADVQRFVICTIQQQLNVAVKQANGERDLNAFGFKLRALADIELHLKERYEESTELYNKGDIDALLAYVSTWYGFGLVKAGFVLQLAFGVSGCIDTHNLKLFNIKKSTVTLGQKVTYKTRLKKAKAYNKLVNKCGGTEFLWDNWCEYVAISQPNSYKDAHEVSRLHQDAIIIRSN